MPDGRRRVYWDACVFLSYINRYSDRIAILDAFFGEAAKSGSNIEILTSTYSIVEVAYAAQEQATKTLDAAIESKIDALWADSDVIKLVEFYESTALLARGLVREAMRLGWKPNPKDAIHLATAQKLQVDEFHTYDEDLDKYKTLIGIKICRPYVHQGQLPLG